MLPTAPTSTLFPYTTLFRSNVLEDGAAVAQAQIVEQSPHDRGVTRIANRAVVERAHLSLQRVAQRSEPARGVERLVGHAIEGKDRKSTRLNSSHVEISYAVF